MSRRAVLGSPGRAWRGGLVALTALLPSCAQAGGTTQGQDVHRLYVIIMALAAPVFVVVEGFLIWCIVRYRKRDDEPPPQTVGGNRSLIVFFLIPAIIVAVLFPFGELTLERVQAKPVPQVAIKVEGFQWEWTFLYLNEGFFVSGKTLVKPAVVEFPVDEPVRIQLTSRDVIHSFFIPGFLFKRDAIPGRINTFTFTPTVLGTYQSQCAEYCGLWHSRMTFVVKVVTSTEYLDWIKQQRLNQRSVTCPVSGTTLDLVAHNISWNTACLAVAANTPFSVQVTNQDDGIQHNFAIYDSFFEKKLYFRAPRITGPASETLQVSALPPGHYYFQCDVHGPAMSGAFVVPEPKA